MTGDADRGFTRRGLSSRFKGEKGKLKVNGRLGYLSVELGMGWRSPETGILRKKGYKETSGKRGSGAMATDEFIGGATEVFSVDSLSTAGLKKKRGGGGGRITRTR